MDLKELHDLIRNGKIDAVRSALEKQPKLIAQADDDGRTPLLWALSETSNFDMISTLLKFANNPKFDIDHSDGAGYTALHIACSRGPQYVDLLMPLNPDIEAKTNQGQTPLILAVSKRQPEVVELLLNQGARPGTKDKRQLSALHRASALGEASMVSLLLSHKSPVNATDMNGWTPLHFAYAEGRTDVIKLLLENGADKSKKNREEQTPEEVVPLNFKYE